MNTSKRRKIKNKQNPKYRYINGMRIVFTEIDKSAGEGETFLINGKLMKRVIIPQKVLDIGFSYRVNISKYVEEYPNPYIAMEINL